MKKSSFKIKIISRLTILGLTCLLSLIGVNSNTSALTYQENVDVNFTLLPAVSISLSSSDLIINNLTPGQNLDSNIITLTAASNSPAGYTISSTVGNSTDYTTTNLKHSTDTSATPAKFTSLATTDSIADLANLTAGYWGYSYSLDHGEHWINATKTGDVNNPGYSGLPLYTTETPTELLTVSTSASSTLDFKIAAAATATQASGEYNNVINFIAVAAPMPTCQSTVTGTMQEFNPCDDVAINTTGTLTDARDNQDYTVAKLADGKWWMTENLNLAGGTAISADTSDVDSSFIDNFTTGYHLTKSGDTIVLPASSLNGFDTGEGAFIYNSGSTSCGNDSPCYSYYSWDAATLISNDNLSSSADAPYSICPKGWHLPSTSSVSVGNTSDFHQLVTAYGATGTPSDASNFYNQAGPNTIPNFLLAGYISEGGEFVEYVGEFGVYWSSTPFSGNALDLVFSSNYLDPVCDDMRSNGYSVRCLFGG